MTIDPPHTGASAQSATAPRELQRLMRELIDGLSEDECFQVAAVVPPLRDLAAPAGAAPSRADRRQKLPRLRKKLRAAPPERLADMLDHLLRHVSHLLAHRGFTSAQITQPDPDELRSMLDALPPLFARLSVLGLLMTDQPASGLARQHEEELLHSVGLGFAGPATTPARFPAQEDGAVEVSEVLEDPTDRVSDSSDGSPLDEVNWSDIRAVVANLGEQAAVLADRLRADADAVDHGRVPADYHGTAEVLTTFAARLEGVLEQVAAVSPDDEMVDLAAVLRVADAADEDRLRREDELAELLAERETLGQAMSTAPPARRARYQALFDDVETQIEQLTGVASRQDPPSGTAEAPIPPPLPSTCDDDIGQDENAASAQEPPIPQVSISPVLAASVNDGLADGELVTPTANDPDPDPDPDPDVDELTASPDLDGERPASGAAAAGGSGAEAQPEEEVTESGGGIECSADAGERRTPVSGPPSERAADQESLRLAFPWDEGDPPPIEQLVAAGRVTEAYWTTAASDELAVRCDVLRFAAVAFAGRGSTAATEALRLDVGAAEDREAVLVETAALLRCSLATGWSHRFPHLESARISLPREWSGLVNLVSSAVQQGCRIEPTTDGEISPDVQGAVAELSDAARRLRDELPNRRNTYQRATRVQQRMLRDDQPLGRLLGVVIGWAEGSMSSADIEHELDALAGPTAVDELIDAADAATRTVNQRDPIVAAARRHLRRTVNQVLDQAHESVALAATLAAPSEGAEAARRELRRAATIAIDVGAPAGVGGACLGLLARWILKPAGRSAARLEVGAADSVPTGPLLLLPELPRLPDRMPDVGNPTSRHVLARLRDDPDPAAAFQRYCETGALDLAARLLTEYESSGIDAELQKAVSHWEATAVRMRDGVVALLDRLRLQDDAEDDVSQHAGRLGAIPAGTAGYDVGLEAVEQLRQALQDRLDEHMTMLRERTESEVRDHELRERINVLLDQHDTATAHEFLAMNRAGERIPASEADPVETLQEFVHQMDDGDADAVARRLAGPDSPLSESGAQGLARWADLAVARETRLRSAVEGVLRLLGLDVIAGSLEKLRLQRRDVLGFEVRAIPRDGSHVTELGSSARNRYKVLVVRDDRRGRSPLDDLDTSAVDVPHVVLYLQPMGLALRTTIAADARRRRTNAIVVDPSVVGWIAARAPGSFRQTQRLTLPWTAFEPYRPYVAGRVPRELFVGRENERRRIVDPGGGMFVYGGRQLGKSALLRHVESEPGDHRTVVYLDLKGLGIGEAEKPDRIWVALSNELKARHVFSTKVSGRPDPATVAQQVKRWLDDDEGRQLLVLADEADAFLTADSRGTPTPGGMQYFPNMIGLKHLMESTDRRFKIVFAGLHQVQRFDRLSNVPTPHGGPAILIGPLEPVAARRLVVEPLAALGYRFERPELVWRLLAETNYQPAPIQIFCAQLLIELRNRHGAEAVLPVTITAADVERTAESGEVRQRIAERLRITINLEDRYRVLALHIARKSIEDRYTAAYGAAGLLEEVRGIWPEGFDASFDESTLAVFLEELVGLGVLVRRPDSAFAVRSPNVVRMLGTREELDRELEASDFDVPYEYNPRLARRLLQQDRRGGEKRSPFTDAELLDLVRAAEVGRLPLVTGTEALAVDRLADALRGFVEGRGEVLEVVRADRFKQQVTARGRATSRWLLLDVRDADGPARDEALKRAREAGGRVVALVDQDTALMHALEGEEIVVPQRWTVDSVRSWPECPYITPELRRRLIEVTGGWPEIVEMAVQQAQVASHTEVALQALRGMGTTVGHAEELLAGAGLDEELRTVLWTWAEATRPGEVLARGDLQGFLELDDAAFTELETRLRLRCLVTDHLDGMALDHLTHRCLTALYGA